jgi:hypothetical protein
MNAILVASVISAAATVIVALLTYLLTKWREREADWRKVKLDLYKEYLNAVAGIADGRMTPESEVRYHDAFNIIGLVASPTVLTAVQALQIEISPANTARTQLSHDEKYTHRVNALRQDLTGPHWRKSNDLNFYIISTRPWSGASTLRTAK